jgi:transcriptional regulator with XRE-family HTH domain
MKTSNPTDQYVGSRVRMRRLMVGKSQEALGDAVGITFQQIQKYEKGTNRISASRLQQFAQIMQVPVAFFFEGAPLARGSKSAGTPAPMPDYVSAFVASTDGLALTAAYTKIKDARLRQLIVDLVRRLAGNLD